MQSGKSFCGVVSGYGGNTSICFSSNGKRARVRYTELNVAFPLVCAWFENVLKLLASTTYFRELRMTLFHAIAQP